MRLYAGDNFRLFSSLGNMVYAKGDIHQAFTILSFKPLIVKGPKVISPRGNFYNKLTKFLKKKAKELGFLTNTVSIVFTNAEYIKEVKDGKKEEIIKLSNNSEIYIITPNLLLDTNTLKPIEPLEFYYNNKRINNATILDFINLVFGLANLEEDEEGYKITYNESLFYNYDSYDIKLINKTYSLIRLSFASPLGHLLIVGEPGLGKSITLQILNSLGPLIASKMTIPQLTFDLRNNQPGLFRNEFLFIDEIIKHFRSSDPETRQVYLSTISGVVARGDLKLESKTSILAVDTIDNIPPIAKDDDLFSAIRQLLDRFFIVHMTEAPIILDIAKNYNFTFLKFMISLKYTSEKLYNKFRHLTSYIVKHFKEFNMPLTYRKADQILKFITTSYILYQLDHINVAHIPFENYFLALLYIITKMTKDTQNINLQQKFIGPIFELNHKARALFDYEGIINFKEKLENSKEDEEGDIL